MAKQTTAPVQLTTTPLASGSATVGQAAIGDRIADELVEAIELAIDADDYCAARGTGATHAECLTVWEGQSWEFSEYKETRQAGITHATILPPASMKQPAPRLCRRPTAKRTCGTTPRPADATPTTPRLLSKFDADPVPEDYLSKKPSAPQTFAVVGCARSVVTQPEEACLERSA